MSGDTAAANALAMLPKAELHCHIEGAASPALVSEQAHRYGVDMSGFIRDGAYVWHDFTSFLAAYDAAAALFRSPEDYARLAERHLTDLSRQGAIYGEIFISPDHAAAAGLDPRDYACGLGVGIDLARQRTGIEGRMIVVGIRHLGAAAAEAAARLAAERPHPAITGFGLAGDERIGAVADFATAFDIAREAGLGLTIHAGEFGGPESVRAALDVIRPARIGHGVRAIEDAALVQRLAEEELVLEVCPGSNVALSLYPSFADHPLPALMAAGVPVTLNADDPPFFATTLADEYRNAHDAMMIDIERLAAITRQAVSAAFVDAATRARLLARL